MNDTEVRGVPIAALVQQRKTYSADCGRKPCGGCQRLCDHD